MKLKDDKRCLIIKGKKGKDYRFSHSGFTAMSAVSSGVPH